MASGKNTAAIGRDDVARIARLAHIDLAPGEIDSLTRDLGRVLAYVDELTELDVSAIPPTAHVQIERAPLRLDEPEPSLPREIALREAPSIEGDGFAVPAFVDEG